MTSRSPCAIAACGCVVDGDRVELATAPEGGALVARYVGADAIRLSPASLETLAIVAYRQPVTKSAASSASAASTPTTPSARLLHRRLVVELGRSGRARPAVPVRHRVRVPRAVRAAQPRGAAAARRRRRRRAWPTRAANRSRSRCSRASRPPASRPATIRPRSPGLMAADRLQKVLAAAGVTSRRGAEALIAAGRVTVDGKVAALGAQVDPDKVDHRRRRPDHRVGGRADVPRAAQARRRDLDDPRSARRHDRARPRAHGPRARRRAPLPGRAAGPGLGGDAPADQRRRLGRACPAPAPRCRARVRRWAWPRRSTATRSRPCRRGSSSTKGWPRSASSAR